MALHEPLQQIAARVRTLARPLRPSRRERSGTQPATHDQIVRRRRLVAVTQTLVTIAVALALAEAAQATVVKPFVIPTPSMEPTLEIGQRILVNRFAYDFGAPHRGDIVVLHPPSSLSCAITNLPSDEACPKSVATHANDYYVKRVIGLPGERLSVRNGYPVIDGRELTNEPYTAPCGDAPACNLPKTIVIPEGDYFMMGDNRGNSDDSRFWGPIPESWIIGEVFASYWPPDRIGIF